MERATWLRSSSARAFFALFLLAACSPTQPDAGGDTRAEASVPRPLEHVQFPTQDGGVVHADLYGSGERGVVLAHGARFEKQSWSKQAQELAAAGFQVLAIDFRGYGESSGPGQAD